MTRTRERKKENKQTEASPNGRLGECVGGIRKVLSTRGVHAVHSIDFSFPSKRRPTPTLTQKFPLLGSEWDIPSQKLPQQKRMLTQLGENGAGVGEVGKDPLKSMRMLSAFCGTQKFPRKKSFSAVALSRNPLGLNWKILDFIGMGFLLFWGLLAMIFRMAV